MCVISIRYMHYQFILIEFKSLLHLYFFCFIGLGNQITIRIHLNKINALILHVAAKKENILPYLGLDFKMFIT